MENNRSGITDEFVEIILPEPKPPAPKKKARWPWVLCGILLLLGVTAGILAFLFSSQGQASPQAVAEQYANAVSAGRTGAVYRLFPHAIQSRHSGSRAALVESLDDFTFAYGQNSDWSILSAADYDPAARLSFSAILGTDITGYQEILLEKTIDGRARRLHLDVIEIGGKWYLAEVWNDDILPGNGFADPESAIRSYLTAFAGADREAMAAALAPDLLDTAIEKEYGLRAMLTELDDFYAASLCGSPVTYTLTHAKDYSAYQTQSMAEVLGKQPQAYRAFYCEATVGDTVYTAVIDLVQVDERWGITALWDYHKSYIL